MSLYNSSFSASAGQRSLRMTDLSGSLSSNDRSTLNTAMFDRPYIDYEFEQQLAASNNEIDQARFDIQVLMTKAHAYCKNSGLSDSDLQLPKTPPRYNGMMSSSAKFHSTPVQNGEFFQSSVMHSLDI